MEDNEGSALRKSGGSGPEILGLKLSCSKYWINGAAISEESCYYAHTCKKKKNKTEGELGFWK